MASSATRSVAPKGGPAGDSPLAPSLEKLQDLKAKLQNELQVSEREKQAFLAEEPQIPLSLADEYKDQKARRTGRGNPAGDKSGAVLDGTLDSSKASGKPAATKANAKQRDMDLLFEMQEKEKRTLEVHNSRLRSLIELRRQSSNRKEDRFKDEVSRLKAKLDSSITVKADVQSSVKEMREMTNQIQQKISQLQVSIEQQAEVDKMNLVRHYRVKLHELKKDLEEEKQTNYTGALDCIDRNNALKKELAQATETLDRITEANSRLVADNKELRKLYREQEDERQHVIAQITTVRKENARLQVQVKALEEETIGFAKRLAKETEEAGPENTGNSGQRSPSPMGHSWNSASRQSTPASHEARYVEMLAKIKRQLEDERRTLKKVRSAHISLLQERTELEVFLQQCLHDVRKEIAKASTSVPPAASAVTNHAQLEAYNVSDRKELLDLLLSKERVLTTLYAKSFPFKLPQDALAHNECPTPCADDVAASSSVLDMDVLWTKWKAWTEKSLP
ncbi:hypothetical protein DIPPA_04670 [Diplonema papillatum]|nr:hypothetical protein DIPPA_04670 [Diplonema papillatum]|eukprot:gene18303-28202_t